MGRGEVVVVHFVIEFAINRNIQHSTEINSINHLFLDLLLDELFFELLRAGTTSPSLSLSSSIISSISILF